MKVELTNTTKKLCVIGDPVLHSKSPLIHNTMLAALGLDYVYLCQPVPRGGRQAEWLRCARVRRVRRIQRHHAPQGGPLSPHGRDRRGRPAVPGGQYGLYKRGESIRI